MAVADVCAVLSDLVRCNPMWSDAVISHTAYSVAP